MCVRSCANIIDAMYYIMLYMLCTSYIRKSVISIFFRSATAAKMVHSPMCHVHECQSSTSTCTRLMYYLHIPLNVRYLECCTTDPEDMDTQTTRTVPTCYHASRTNVMALSAVRLTTRNDGHEYVGRLNGIGELSSASTSSTEKPFVCVVDIGRMAIFVMRTAAGEKG